MGNCFIRESAILWAGEDWGFPASEEFNADTVTKLQEEKKTEHCHSPAKKKKAAATTTTTEVKIRITKKQLEELLGKVEVQGILVEQLRSVSDRFETNQRSWRWRPALQSIPEIN